MRKIGKIKWFGGHNNKTGSQNDFGFIACEGKPNDIFVHLRQINCSATALIEETIVTFEVITNFRDGKEEAKNLRLLIDETDTEIITFCATNKDPNLWIPVFSKYFANFSINAMIFIGNNSNYNQQMEESTMLIEEYFEFLADDDIRVKGTRVGIESILYEYIYQQRSPEEILKHFYTLTLDQVYATILYYLNNKAVLDKYIEDWLEWSHEQRKSQELNPHPASARLQKIKEERNKKNGTQVSHG